MASLTARQSIDNWTSSLQAFFDLIEAAARPDEWRGERPEIEVREDPLNLGGSVLYHSTMLILRRASPRDGAEQRITFEPRHRFTLGAAGRIDVYSYPSLREALLLRIADTKNAEDLTWEEAEERVAKGKWKAFSQDRLPLNADLNTSAGLREFLLDMVD